MALYGALLLAPGCVGLIAPDCGSWCAPSRGTSMRSGINVMGIARDFVTAGNIMVSRQGCVTVRHIFLFWHF